MGAFIFGLGAVLGLIGSIFVPAEDPGSRLLRTAGPSIYTITPPSNNESGGTGFALLAPSGEIYTVTNAHVCEVQEDGFVAAYPNNSKERVLLKVIEISTTTDLCLIEGFPGAEPLQVALGVDPFAAVYALGHPYLEANTLTRGYVTGCRDISIQKDWVEVVTVYGCLTSVIIFPGNSGSPALDESGRVLGVFFAGDGRTNYGAFVPLEDLLEFVSER